MAFKGDSIFWVEVDKVVANPFQPRREFNEAKLQELADSVKMYGILQPLTVTRKEITREDGTFYSEYELIAGERRLRASRLAGLQQVPVIIREGEQSEQEKLELAIIENLQREDLNAVDRALAFRQLADAFGLSHGQVAKKVGRSREYVSNTLRLLLLPEYMLEALKIGDISEGHGRTLLMLNDKPEEQDTVYREILLKKLSVREVERIARKIASDKVRKKKWQNTDPELIAIEKQFTESLGTRVQIAKTDYGGKISIDYFSQDDLAEILERLKKDAARSQSQVTAAAAVTTAVSHTAAEYYDETEEILEKVEAATPLTTVETPSEPIPKETVDTPEEVTAKEEIPTQKENTSQSDEEVEQSAVPQQAYHHTQQIPPFSQPSEENEPQVKPEPASTPEPDTTPALQEPVQSEIQPDPEPQKQHEPFMTVEDVRAKEEDDSDLYGIKNFSL